MNFNSLAIIKYSVILCFALYGCSSPSSKINESTSDFKIRNNLEQGKKYSEKELLFIVKKYPHLMEFINNPSETVQLEAVMTYGIGYIKNPSESVQLASLRKDINSFNILKKPSEAAKKLAKNYASKTQGVIFLDNKLRGKWDFRRYPSRMLNMTASDEVELLKALKNADYSNYSSTEYYREFKSRVRSEAAQLLLINENEHNIGYFKLLNPAIKKLPKVIAYKNEKRIAELKRKKEETEYSSSNSSSSSSTSSSYSAPQQRTCTRIRYRTEYAPGNSRRMVRIPYNEDYSC